MTTITRDTEKMHYVSKETRRAAKTWSRIIGTAAILQFEYGEQHISRFFPESIRNASFFRHECRSNAQQMWHSEEVYPSFRS